MTDHGEPTTDASRPGATPERHRRLGYQPALDGMRAVAIALVVAFHLDIGHGPVLPGGFLGVDVFFVLSGFLITSLLVDERVASGSIGLRPFWARHAARLLPLLVALMAVAAADRWIVNVPGITSPSPLGFLAIFGYVGNWLAVYGHKSFGSFEYMWSLAVEEQFYVVWPVLAAVVLGLSARRGRRGDHAPRVTALALVAGLGALASMVARLRYWDATIAWHRDNPFDILHIERHRYDGWGTWFFNTALRADGLLVGATLAATRGRWQRLLSSTWAATAAASLGLGVATWVVLRSAIFQEQVPRTGIPTLVVATAVAAGGLVALPGAPLSRLLASPPMVWIGRRSYAMYLLHIPVFGAVGAALRSWSPGARAVVGVLATVLASHVAHRSIEVPAQRFIRRRLRAEVAAPPAPISG